MSTSWSTMHCGIGGGVTSVGTNRLHHFKTDGWKLLNLELFANGAHALAIEGAIKRWWRVELGLPMWLGPDDRLKTSGWTETVHSDEVSAHECIARIQSAAAILRSL
jgi:hypothetical protein